jgi:hypothetical protein
MRGCLVCFSILGACCVQLTYGLSFAGALAFASFLYLLVAEGNFQLITSVAVGAYLAAIIVATILSKETPGPSPATNFMSFSSNRRQGMQILAPQPPPPQSWPVCASLRGIGGGGKCACD